MASLVLVLREGSIKQALVTLDDDDAIDQPTLNAVAALLNERARRTRPRAGPSARLAPARRRRPRRTARPPRRRADRPDRSATTTRDAVEEVFSDGLLNVMEAPEFAQSEKLRRVFARAPEPGLPRRARRQRRRRRPGPGLHRPRERSRSRCATSRSSSRRTAGRGRAIGVVGVLGPTRMAYSAGDRHGPLRVRPHERAGGPPLRLTSDDRHETARPGARSTRSTSRRPRCSPQIEQLDGRASTRAPSRRDEYLAALAARARRVPELQAPDRPRSASAMLGLAGEDLIRKVLRSPTTSTAPSRHGRTASPTTPGSRASRPSTASSACSSRARA